MLNLDIITSAPPLGCLCCVICNSNSFHFFFSHFAYRFPTYWKCAHPIFVQLWYIFSHTILDDELRHIFTPTTHRFTSATLMGCLLCVICNSNSFHSFYTNLAYIQISSEFLGRCVWRSIDLHGLPLYISINNQYFGDTGPEQSLVLLIFWEGPLNSENKLGSKHVKPGQGLLNFSCSTQLFSKFILLINVKMPTIVGILTFISMINATSERLKARRFFICRYLSFY